MKRINLIPQEAKKITPNKWLKFYLLKTRTRRIIAMAVVGFVLFNLWQATSLLRYRFAITQAKKNISRLQVKLSQSQSVFSQIKTQRDEVDRETKRLEEKFRILQQAQAESMNFAKVMTRLSALIPQDLWISKVKFNDDLLTLVGTTFDNTIVSRFMSELDKSQYFKETSFTYTQKAKVNDKPVINFEVYTHAVLDKTQK